MLWQPTVAAAGNGPPYCPGYLLSMTTAGRTSSLRARSCMRVWGERGWVGSQHRSDPESEGAGPVGQLGGGSAGAAGSGAAGALGVSGAAGGAVARPDAHADCLRLRPSEALRSGAPACPPTCPPSPLPAALARRPTVLRKRDRIHLNVCSHAGNLTAGRGQPSGVSGTVVSTLQSKLGSKSQKHNGEQVRLALRRGT